jgi:hypothetical protein
MRKDNWTNYEMGAQQQADELNKAESKASKRVAPAADLGGNSAKPKKNKKKKKAAVAVAVDELFISAARVIALNATFVTTV